MKNMDQLSHQQIKLLLGATWMVVIEPSKQNSLILMAVSRQTLGTSVAMKMLELAIKPNFDELSIDDAVDLVASITFAGIRRYSGSKNGDWAAICALGFAKLADAGSKITGLDQDALAAASGAEINAYNEAAAQKMADEVIAKAMGVQS